MSDDFMQHKRSVINVLNGVLRTSALKDHDIGQQRLILLVDQLLEKVGPGGAVPLGPIYEYLKEQRADEDAILEALLVFQERGPSLGVEMSLPPAVEGLSRDRRQRLLLRYEKRQRGPRPKAPEPAAPAEPHAPMAPLRGGGAGAPSARWKPLAAVVGMLAIVAGAVTLWQRETSAPVAVAVVIDDPRGLPCAELKGNHGILMCWMSSEGLQKLSAAERKARGAATKAAGAGLGYTSLQLWTLEDRVLRQVF